MLTVAAPRQLGGNRRRTFVRYATAKLAQFFAVPSLLTSVIFTFEIQLAKTLLEFLLLCGEPFQQAFLYFEMKCPKLIARHFVDLKFRHLCPRCQPFASAASGLCDFVGVVC